MIALKITAVVVDYRVSICRQFRANLFQTFQWSNEDTHSPEKSISPSEGQCDPEDVATMEGCCDCFGGGHVGTQVKAIKSRVGLSVRT